VGLLSERPAKFASLPRKGCMDDARRPVATQYKIYN
jgi:hypothetical protein